MSGNTMQSTLEARKMAIALLLHGFSMTMVAQKLGIRRQTLHAWLNRYNITGSVEGKAKSPKRSNKRKLSSGTEAGSSPNTPSCTGDTQQHQHITTNPNTLITRNSTRSIYIKERTSETRGECTKMFVNQEGNDEIEMEVKKEELSEEELDEDHQFVTSTSGSFVDTGWAECDTEDPLDNTLHTGPSILSLPTPEDHPLLHEKVILMNIESQVLPLYPLENSPLLRERLSSTASNQSVLGATSQEEVPMPVSDPLEMRGPSHTVVLSDTDGSNNSVSILSVEKDRNSTSHLVSQEIKEDEKIGSEKDEDNSFNAIVLDSDSSNVDSENEDSARKVHLANTESIEEVPWVWKSGDFSPNLFLFDSTNYDAPATSKIKENSSELDFFLYFFDRNLMELITRETNQLYIHVTKPSMRYCDGWWDVTVSEMYVFLGLCMLRPHIKESGTKKFWNALQDFNPCKPFQIMKETRYKMITKMLHFSNNCVTTNDPLAKIRPVLSSLQDKFKAAITPSRNLMIHESQVLFRDLLPCYHSNPSTNHDYEAKPYVLCDCKTGFVIDVLIYSKEATEGARQDTHGTSGSIVKQLLTPLYGKGHTLFVGEWCTNPRLFQYLHTRKVGACGMMKPSLRNCPCFGRTQTGSSIAYHANDVVALKWEEQCVLSTVHGWEAAKKCKPQAVVNYRNSTKGFGIADLQINPVRIGVLKWYKRLFFHLLDLAVLNSYTLYVMRTRTRLKYQSFHQRLTRQILDKFGRDLNRTSLEQVDKFKAEKNDLPLRFMLAKGHFIRAFQDEDNKGRHERQNCIVCLNTTLQKKTQKGTGYYCSVCNVPLCVIPCFEKYHTLEDF